MEIIKNKMIKPAYKWFYYGWLRTKSQQHRIIEIGAVVLGLLAALQNTIFGWGIYLVCVIFLLAKIHLDGAKYLQK